MALVVCNGQQWDDESLPANIDPKDCVPLDEWYKSNRSVKPASAEPKAAPKKTAAKKN